MFPSTFATQSFELKDVISAPVEIYLIVLVLSGVMLVASLIGFMLRYTTHDDRKKLAFENLNSRILAWWIMVFVIGVAGLAGRSAVVLLFALVSLCALREFITVTETERADRAALFASFCIALPMQYLLIWTGWYGLFSIFIPVYGFVVLPILAALTAETSNFLARTAETQWGVMIAVYCVSYVPALWTLSIPGFQSRIVLLMAFFLIVTQFSDVFQYIFGKLAGRHRISPRVSPSKTLEGLVGGIICATIVGASLWRLTPFSPRQAGMMALMICITGFLGGLVMSAIKRDRNIKDWGHLIAGHGGMLDRIDSVCFSAPVFFHLTRYFFTP